MELKKFEVNARSSRMVVAGDLVFIGGTTAPNDVEGVQAQAKFVFGRFEELLAQAGTSKAKLVSATIYLRTMDDFDAFNEAWNDWLKDVVPPSRACVSPALVGNHALCEISLIAAL